MIDGLNRYPSYKASGLPWLGDIPTHWDSPRLKTVFREVDRRSGTGLEPLLSLRMQRGLVDHHEMGGKPIPPSSLMNYKRTEPGEIVMNRMRAAAGLFGVTPKVGLVSPDYAVLRPRRPIALPYFVHLFRTPSMMSIFRLESRGLGTGESGFLRLYTDRFGMIAAPVPPSDEQDAIVRFLDHADRRIRRNIAAKQRLIKLLEEQRRGIIHRAVTRGVNPSVGLKPSGVPWLGDVPAHWRVARIKTEFKSLNSRRVPLSSSERGLMITRLYDYYGASGAIDKVDDYLFDGELLLIAEDGANLVLRNLPLAIIARGKFWVNNHAHILEPRRGNIEYLAAYLETIDYTPWITGAAQPKLTKDRLMSVRIAVPEPPEQDAIMRAVAEETRILRSSIDIARREVALLREFRTRLVADVVTGRLDVRAAAAGFPDEPTQPESLDIADEVEAENVDPEGDGPPEADAA